MERVDKVKEKKYSNNPEKVLQFGEGNFLRAFSDYIIDKANGRGEFNGSVVLSEPRGNHNTSEKINSQNAIYTVITRGIESEHAKREVDIVNNASRCASKLNGLEGLERLTIAQPVKEVMSPTIEMMKTENAIHNEIIRENENRHVKEEIDVITSISRCINPLHNFDELKKIIVSKEIRVIISNTTEAGIVFDDKDKLTDYPPSSFPAKLTALLYERYKYFLSNDKISESDILILPTELIDYNGDVLKTLLLKYAILWQLEDNFRDWLNTHVYFANTLVDRIVTGYPKDEEREFEIKLGYKDSLMVACEFYYLWVIEVKEEHRKRAKELFAINDKNVLWSNVLPYKQRKVKILNGGHTSTVLAAYLCGYEYVLDFITDEVFSTFLKKLLFDEVIPTIDLDKKELETFAITVIDRFSNPYIKHRLLDISLNSSSKVIARLVPSIQDYYNKNRTIPKLLTFSIASFILFYKGIMRDGKYIGKNYKGVEYEIRDSKEVIDYFNTLWNSNNERETIVSSVLKEILKIENIFGLDKLVVKYIEDIEEHRDIRYSLKKIIS